jgi:hypothetical protein
MKTAANILVAGLLLFGFAAFAFIQNALLRGDTPWYGYVFLALSLLFGIFLFALFLFQNDKIAKLSERLKAVTNSLNVSKTKYDKELIAEEQASSRDAAAKVASAISFNRELEAITDEILVKLAKEVSFAHGVMFVASSSNSSFFEPKAKYAFYSERELDGFTLGEGVNGQAAKDRQPVLLESIPENYVAIVSGLGKSSPRALSFYPVVYNGQTVALLELAFLAKPSAQKLEIIGIFCEAIAEKLTQKQLA